MKLREKERKMAESNKNANNMKIVKIESKNGTEKKKRKLICASEWRSIDFSF